MDQILMGLSASFFDSRLRYNPEAPLDKVYSESEEIHDVLDLANLDFDQDLIKKGTLTSYFFEKNFGKKRKRALKSEKEKASAEEEKTNSFSEESFTQNFTQEKVLDSPRFIARQEEFPFSEFIVAVDEESYRALASRLSLLPPHALIRCVEFGSRFYCMKQSAPLPIFKETLSKEYLELLGGYVPRLKACYLWKEVLSHPAFENFSLILFSHAYDHCLGGDNFSSLQSPLVHSLYLSCRQRKPGHRFLSGYSEAGSAQYFAQSLAAYFSLEDTLWGRKALKGLDPDMYEYLTCLFK